MNASSDWFILQSQFNFYVSCSHWNLKFNCVQSTIDMSSVWMLFHFRWHGFSFMVVIENVHGLASRSISVWKWHFFIVLNTWMKCMLVCWNYYVRDNRSLHFCSRIYCGINGSHTHWLTLNICFHKWGKKVMNENSLWCTPFYLMILAGFHTSQQSARWWKSVQM